MTMNQGVMLGTRILKRAVMSFGVVTVNALSKWTDENMSIVQGMCLIALLFITAVQLNRRAVQPRLIRLVCLLYCNQRIRRIYSAGNSTSIDLFPNILLATALAVFLIAITETQDSAALDDMKTMLEALLYMYGDILDFLFQYGILTLTLAAFAAGLVFQMIPPPEDPIKAFFCRMAGIVSTNLLYQGITSLINSSGQIELIESIAAASIIRMIFPSMESYLTYLTAAQLTKIIPDIAPIMGCIIVCADMLPSSSRGWISETCTTYVILAVMNYLVRIPIWGVQVILIFAHYVDYVSMHLD
jgi:hypothetical protein